MLTPLEQSIIKTCAYFAVAETPLTREELFQYLWEPPPNINFERFTLELDQIIANQSLPIERRAGFIVPLGREELVQHRQISSVACELKLRYALRACRLISWFPFVRAIFVCNSVAVGTATEVSDIDFFIITETKRIWLVRLFANVILRSLGLRTYGHKQRDRVCLSFFIGAGNLSLAPYRITGVDAHLAYWLHQMIPLYDPHKYHARFLKANDWTALYLPHASKQGGGEIALARPVSKIANAIKQIGEAFWRGSYGNLIEKQAKEIQLLKMSSTIKKLAEQSGVGVILGDDIIKLHEQDARESYRDKWLQMILKMTKSKQL